MYLKGIALASIALPCLAAANIGPTGRLYFTVSSAPFLGITQGTSEQLNLSVFSGEGPIAVFNGIQTTGSSNLGFGASYDLAETFTGGLNQSFVPGTSTDGTTDGVHNYLVNESGDVFSTNSTFQLPTLLFLTNQTTRGIAYDPSNKSLWMNVNGAMVDYSLTGDILSSFALSGLDGSAIAYDQEDLTLWVATARATSTEMQQYTRDGQLLQDYFLNSPVAISGMEFNEAVPEPASLPILGVGVLALFGRRRYKA